MKKFTTWNYGTHKCILWHDLVRQNIVLVTGCMWKCQRNHPDKYSKDLVNFKQFDDMIIVSADVHSMKLIFDLMTVSFLGGDSEVLSEIGW